MTTMSTGQSKPDYIWVKHVNDVNVKMSTDGEDCYITGVVVIKDGKLAVADFNNKCVKIIDKIDERKSEKIALTSRPLDITTLCGGNLIQFLSVSPTLSARHSITVPGVYRGLTYNEGKFFLTCHLPVKSAHIYDVAGNLLQKIITDNTGNTLFKWPLGITLNADKNVLYVSDADSNTIVSLNSDGGVMATYTNGMLQRPYGITVDQHGHLYICSHDNNRVIELSSSGQLGNVLIEQKDGILSPRAITYNTGQLYVSSDNYTPEYLNNIKVYKLEYSNGTNMESLFERCVGQQTETKLPNDWPNEEAVKAPVFVNQCVRTMVRDTRRKENVYSMIKRKRGRCVIIANKHFRGKRLSTRHGSENDEDRLSTLFQQLYFEVVMHKDKTTKEMFCIMQEEAQNNDHKEAECFVCIVCSHGNRKGVYGTDERVLALDVLTSSMDGKHCKALRRKPKLFFIQACTGRIRDKQADGVNNGQDLSQIFNSIHTRAADSDRDGDNVPTKADMFVACATHPGYVSYRDTAYGTWFIQAVIYVFQTYAHQESIAELFPMVNDLVARAEDEENQACQYQSSLRKKLYFFPGVSTGS